MFLLLFLARNLRMFSNVRALLTLYFKALLYGMIKACSWPGGWYHDSEFRGYAGSIPRNFSTAIEYLKCVLSTNSSRAIKPKFRYTKYTHFTTMCRQIFLVLEDNNEYC